MQIFPETGVGSLVYLYNAHAIQHPVEIFGKPSSGG